MASDTVDVRIPIFVCGCGAYAAYGLDYLGCQCGDESRYRESIVVAQVPRPTMDPVVEVEGEASDDRET